MPLHTSRSIAPVLLAAALLLPACCAKYTADLDAINAAIAHPDRPEPDVERDADRQPREILSIMQVHPGMTIADLMAGGGYYTELLARTVGPTGTVYLQNSPFVVQRFADAQIKARLADNRLPNVQRVDCELTELPFEDESLDAAFMVLFYHDTYWMELDRPKLLSEIMRSLKPGGVFALIDHAAEPGSGARDVKTLHRVDEALVKQELLAAGFELEAESDVLRHPEDDHTINVFKPEIRGKTDRFVYRFRKPK